MNSIISLVALALLAGCKTLSDTDDAPPYPEARDSYLGEMANVVQCGKIWIGSTPSAEDMNLVVRRGVETVLDASEGGEEPEFNLSGFCDQFGLRYVKIEVTDGGVVTEEVDRTLTELNFHGKRPVLLFCGNGRRSAMLLAIYRVLQDGVPYDVALADARRSGMKPGDAEFVRDEVELRQGELAGSP